MGIEGGIIMTVGHDPWAPVMIMFNFCIFLTLFIYLDTFEIHLKSRKLKEYPLNNYSFY